jgi:hypothetical protein
MVIENWFDQQKVERSRGWWGRKYQKCEEATDAEFRQT